MKTQTKFRSAAVLLAGLLGVTACSGSGGADPAPEDTSWSAVEKRASGQGALQIYSVGSTFQNDRLVEAFAEAHPDIPVNVTRGSTELVPRLDAEISGGQDGADIFIFPAEAWYLDNEEHLLSLSDNPSVGEWPEGDWAVENKAAYVSYYPTGIITWNTDIFPQGFSDWTDLTEPDVNGKLGIMSVIVEATAQYYQFLEDVEGEGYLEDLAAQNPRFYPSTAPMTQAIASGEIGVSGLGPISSVLELQEQGAPIDYAVPDESFANYYIAAGLEKTARPDAARVFMEFFLSPEGQSAFNGGEVAGSALEGANGTLDTSGFLIPEASDWTPDRVSEWEQKFNGIFGIAQN